MHGKSLALVATAALAALAVAACSRGDKPANEVAPPVEADVAVDRTTAAPAVTTDTGSESMTLQKTDLAPGAGAEISSGQNALVHYTGWLYDAAAPENKGKQFDSSVGGEPFEFPLGAATVIAGWDQGVAGMKVGGKRRLVIPPAMGYSARGVPGVIPPNATLLFEVELVEIR
jgi:FKBP-type peptidyl-prolyl cis-trans isomerase FkpA